MNYKQTLNLPKTDFPMQAKLKELEPKILAFWEKQNIYELIRNRSKKLPKYILHDGPPYANGDIHIGHALNKTLKDFVVKYKIMRGFNVPFVPGWDCHGLPVEHQLFKELGINKHEIDKVEFRKKAKQFALRFVDIQRQQFKRLGLLADWEHPYLTLDPLYEAEIVRAIAKLVKDNYIYHGLKPINWCKSCETALAEAELEYEDHRSPSIFVKFPLPEAENALKDLVQITSHASRTTVSFLIWTTTPWTLLANVAIALHPDFNYSLIEISSAAGAREIFILMDELVPSVMRQAAIKEYKKIGELKGSRLEGLKARHPFIQRDSEIVLAEYVSNEEGTGCVHTAPGHGEEDYMTGLKYKLQVIMPVDEKGVFDNTCGEFSGVDVFKANDMIIEAMKKNQTLFYACDILHSYPHCWRCKSPLITRSTRQWFINVDHKDLRKKALEVVKRVRWIPEGGASRISGMIESRPDWCLSRQRYWGVPIPVFYCKSCGKEIVDARAIENFAEIVAREGTDAWFLRSVDELLGKKVKCPECKKEEFVKEEDIIDVWFDSGVSHQAVLARNKELGFPASLYLEGSDQHRGWFQTALLTSIPLTGKAPYDSVLTHGFTVDGDGKKMSKSRGNVVSPLETIDQYGAEILRLWVAYCDYSDDVRISPKILTGIADAYRKIRNTLRFLLGNLYDYRPQKKVEYSQLWEIDKWALSALSGLLEKASEDFEDFLYYKMFRRLYNFCTVEMSSFYLDILKDRLYTMGSDSLARRSAQTVMYEILSALNRVIAPILSFTAEELWGYFYKIQKLEKLEPVILSGWPKVESSWIDPELDEKFKRLEDIRDAALKVIENEREKGLIKSSLEARVGIFTTDEQLYLFLKENLELLVSIFIVSDVTLEKVRSFPEQCTKAEDVAGLAIKAEKIEFAKCERCWNYRRSVGKDMGFPKLCKRCIEVIDKEE
ncbi:MAG: isoleucine--tRNA ligase [Candidatus Omnitrophica bacterium]|nr:isoleucine--tRNA ligase [Candidatus Omnitrophota bacterium]